MTSVTGTGAAPQSTQRSVRASCACGSYTACMNCSIAGTSSVVLIFSSRISSHASLGSKAFRITCVQPRYTQHSDGISAPTWNSGNAVRKRSL